jgi:iron complex outermembrane recepter protein
MKARTEWTRAASPRVAWAVATALVLAADPLTAQPAESVAPDDEAERLQTVVVTGTHIRRIELEGPLPVSVIERETLLAGGRASIADAVRDLPWNSFGSFGDVPNTDVPNASLPRLRGLGSKYTLTLIDGRRLPGFASLDGGAAASLAGIPLIAIDRIEVLRDGASAIYGSDAIGGVINLISRRENTPPQFELQWEQPQDDGGEAWRAGFTTSWGNAHGHLLLALESQDRAPLLGAQREYLIANASFVPTGNPGSFRRLNPVTGAFVGVLQPDARCPQAFDSDPLFPSSSVRPFNTGRICAYRFRDLAMERAAQDSRSLFANGRHDLGPSLTGVARILVIDADGTTQLAPTPAGGLFMAADNPNNPTRGEVGPELGHPLFLLYRLTALGPRVTDTSERSLHAMAGLEGGLAWADGGDWSLTFSHNRYTHRAIGTAGHALREPFQTALATGRFNPFAALPDDPTGLEDARYQPRRDSETRATSAGLGFTLDAALPGGFAASHAFGIDLRREQFASIADPVSVRGDVFGQGQAEAPQRASRNYAGVYAETFVPLAERWELSVAARYDRYQDAGGKLSPKVALAWRPAAPWLLRGSLGRGFQAPDLVSAYGGFATFNAFDVDPTACATRPADPNACDLWPFEVQVVPNAALGPERARQGTLGVAWQPTEGIDLGLDYVYTRIEGQIGTLTPRDALLNELECARSGQGCDPVRDGSVQRNAFGNIERVTLPWINIAGTRVEALDFQAGSRHDTAIGTLALTVTASRVLGFERQLVARLPAEELDGAQGRPRWRGLARADWQGATHGLSFGLGYIAGHGACDPARFGDGRRNPACARRIPSHVELDAQWRMTLPWNGEIAVGGRNLRNRPPAFDPAGNFSYGLYDPNGRVWYLRYRHQF